MQIRNIVFKSFKILSLYLTTSPWQNKLFKKGIKVDKWQLFILGRKEIWYV